MAQVGSTFYLFVTRNMHNKKSQNWARIHPKRYSDQRWHRLKGSGHVYKRMLRGNCTDRCDLMIRRAVINLSWDPGVQGCEKRLKTIHHCIAGRCIDKLNLFLRLLIQLLYSFRGFFNG